MRVARSAPDLRFVDVCFRVILFLAILFFAIFSQSLFRCLFAFTLGLFRHLLNVLKPRTLYLLHLIFSQKTRKKEGEEEEEEQDGNTIFSNNEQ